MLDGRPWLDILTTVDNFYDVIGWNKIIQEYPFVEKLMGSFDITKIKEIYIPYNGCYTHEQVEEERYSSGYFIMTDGKDLLIRLCDQMFIPIFESPQEPHTYVGVRFNLNGEVVTINVDTCSPYYKSGETPLYYKKEITPMISDLANDSESQEAIIKAFRYRFEDGYSKSFRTAEGKH